jgi:hypothetical protein
MKSLTTLALYETVVVWALSSLLGTALASKRKSNVPRAIHLISEKPKDSQEQGEFKTDMSSTDSTAQIFIWGIKFRQ